MLFRVRRTAKGGADLDSREGCVGRASRVEEGAVEAAEAVEREVMMAGGAKGLEGSGEAVVEEAETGLRETAPSRPRARGSPQLRVNQRD